MHLNRLDPARLAIPVAATGVGAAAFAVLTDAVTEQNGLTRIDPHVASDALNHRTTVLTELAHALTFLGSEVLVGAVALLLFVSLLERRRAIAALIAAATMTIAAGLTIGLKLTIGRARPGTIDRLGPVDNSYSFPSGHTLNSAVLLGLAVLLLVPLLTSRLLRIMALVSCLVLAVSIGASRVYLGYHWTTDVLASWAIATVLLVAAHIAIAALTADPRRPLPRTPRPR